MGSDKDLRPKTATTTTTTMIAAWAPGETWIEPVSVPDAPAVLSGLVFRGAAPFALDVAVALTFERDTEDDAEGFEVGDGIVREDIAVALNPSKSHSVRYER